MAYTCLMIIYGGPADGPVAMHFLCEHEGWSWGSPGPIVVHTCNLCTGEIETRGSPELTGQPVSTDESGSSGIDDRPCLGKAR